MGDEIIPPLYKLVLRGFDGTITADLENHARHRYAVGDELAEKREGKWRVVEIGSAPDGTPTLICEQTY